MWSKWDFHTRLLGVSTKNQMLWKRKIEGSFQIGRFEMALLQAFSWDYRIKSWSDQVIPGKKEHFVQRPELVKGLACLRNGKTASVARADRARSTGPEKPWIQLSRQARRLHAFAGHCKDLDGISARWEVIKEFRQRNNALKTAFVKDHVGRPRRWVEHTCVHEWKQGNHSAAFGNNPSD